MASALIMSITAYSSNTDDTTSGTTVDTTCSVSVILKTTAPEYWQYVVAGAETYETDHPEVNVDVKDSISKPHTMNNRI